MVKVETEYNWAALCFTTNTVIVKNAGKSRLCNDLGVVASLLLVTQLLPSHYLNAHASAVMSYSTQHASSGVLLIVKTEAHFIINVLSMQKYWWKVEVIKSVVYWETGPKLFTWLLWWRLSFIQMTPHYFYT